MKKSFKRIVAVLLAVMMIVCSFPLTVLAADSNRTNINLQFGDVSNKKDTPKNYNVERRGASINDFVNYSGLNSTKLDYSNGKIAGYSKGDFFTVSVLVENVSKIAAAEVAIKYSDSISPAYIKNVNSGTAVVEYTEGKPAIEGFQPLEAITQQSGDAIHNKTHTLGETSYVDADKKIIHAKFAAQAGTDYADTSIITAGKQELTNTAVLATFMFKIVSDGDITFTLDTPEEAYYLETIANGGKVNEYKTYVPKSQGAEAELDFMGKNEYNGSTSTSYTITFNDENGKVLQSRSYEEGTDVIAPALPAVTHDDEKHYTYSWDKEVVSPAAANATYTRVKTGAVHEWNQGVVTKEPTTTETGIKTYTCTFDGCGATKTETLPKKEDAHVHTWSEWKYNGDAKWDATAKVGTNGTQTRTCTECGETETKEAPHTDRLCRQATQLSIDSAILVKTWVPKDVCDYYDSFYMSVTYTTREGVKTEVVDEYGTGTSKGVKYYTFSFDKIMPHTLNEEATYTFYGIKDGVTYWGDAYNYAITTYLKSQLDKYNTTAYPTSYSNYRRLLADIIWYGYKAQIQQGYGITNGNKKPMTDYITPEQLAYRTTEDITLKTIDDKNYVTIDNPSAQIGTNLRMGASVDLVVVMAKKTTSCPALDTLQVEVTKEGQQPEIFTVENNPDMFQVSGKYLNFYYNGVKGNEASIPVYVRLLDANGNVISNTRRMSIESYCYSQITGTKATQALKDVCDAIMRYAKSSAQYIANKKA
ncbi:hypothetical protein [uncultured Eubacterium sp.]|uniref:hypothetical protein n=1 Tax=uncultured Eubacterium sp. TaxID=165185 RepID=UPI0025EAB5AF|nr:hypothetical protein [uncultured Eubacterium sp.]